MGLGRLIVSRTFGRVVSLLQNEERGRSRNQGGARSLRHRKGARPCSGSVRLSPSRRR